MYLIELFLSRNMNYHKQDISIGGLLLQLFQVLLF